MKPYRKCFLEIHRSPKPHQWEDLYKWLIHIYIYIYLLKRHWSVLATPELVHGNQDESIWFLIDGWPFSENLMFVWTCFLIISSSFSMMANNKNLEVHDWLNHDSWCCHLKSLRLQHDSECCYCWKSLANRLEAFKHDALEALRVGCWPWIEMGKRLIYEKDGDADVVVNQEYDDFLWFGDHVSMIFYDFESSKSHLVKVGIGFF